MKLRAQQKLFTSVIKFKEMIFDLSIHAGGLFRRT